MNSLSSSSRRGRTARRLAEVLSLVAALLSTSPPLEAGGLFTKLKERKRKAQAATVAPKPKPSQGSFTPRSRPAYRAEPVAPVSPANYRPDPPGPNEGLPGIVRTRAGQIRIFVLADSQGLMPFGEELQRSLVGQGHEVLMHAVKNGTPYFWQGQWPSPVLTRVYEAAAAPEQCGRWLEVSMSPRSIADYVAAYDPDVFVFQAGTNFEEDLASKHPGVARMMAESLREAGVRGARVLWIGPPDARDDVKSVEFQDRATASLRAALAPLSASQGLDCFFDSRPVCPIPNESRGDGEHPSNETGREWGRAAAAWVEAAISAWQEQGSLRPPGGSPGTAADRLFAQRLVETPPDPADLIPVELEFIARSDPGEIRTLAYTDAFSVCRYRVRNAGSLGDRLASLGVNPDPGSSETFVYVLHWAVHNDGSGPRATRLASRNAGDLHSLDLCRIDEHPLGDALGTMPRFDEFNDLEAPLFVAADLLAERAF